MSINFAYRLSEETELRLLEPRHAGELFALIDRNREHVGRFTRLGHFVQSVDNVRPHLAQTLCRFAEDGTPNCGIWHRGALVGAIDLLRIDQARCGEVGYWLDEGCQGRGIMTTACRALVNHAFSVLGANRMQICAQPENTRSRAIPERLGFTEEGTLRQVMNMGDYYADRVVYGMLRDEWQDTGQRLTFSSPLTDAELRLLQPHQAEAIFALVDQSREHLGAWFPWPAATQGVDDIRAFIARTIRAMADENEIFWGIWHQGHYAGAIGTLPINWNAREVYLAYWLGEEYQGRGLITRAAQKLLTHLFEDRQLNRVGIRYNPKNVRSAAVARRLGFTVEGTHRQAYWHFGNPEDVTYTALLREEWMTGSGT